MNHQKTNLWQIQGKSREPLKMMDHPLVWLSFPLQNGPKPFEFLRRTSNPGLAEEPRKLSSRISQQSSKSVRVTSSPFFAV